jgi:hypothetical protein
MSDPTQKPEFELVPVPDGPGEVRHNKKGNSVLLAKYDYDSGLLTIESFETDKKFRTQICRAIMEDPMTGELTGRAVKGYAIAGRPIDRIKPGEPLPPKKSKQYGDKTPEFVRWLKRWRPQAFYARYGVLLDSNGEPRTAHCIRREQGLLEAQVGTEATVIMGDGKDALSRTVIEREDGILALRGTCETFTVQEQVGYAEDEGSEDDSEPTPSAAAEEPELATAEAAPAKRGPGRPAKNPNVIDD